LEEPITLSSNWKESVMPFTGIAHPEQLKALTEALEAFCRAEGIEPGTEAYEDAAHMIMHLFNNGAGSAEDICEALRSGLDRMRAA
jgi:hypothetical protein